MDIKHAFGNSKILLEFQRFQYLWRHILTIQKRFFFVVLISTIPLMFAFGATNPDVLAPTSKDSVRASELLIHGIRTFDGKIIVESIASGVDVNRPDPYGGTPLMWAFYFGQQDVVELLLSHQADPFKQGVIYRNKTFENYYGDLLSICLFKSHGGLLKLALSKLKIPWDNQQYDPFSFGNYGQTAIAEFLIFHLRNDLELSEKNKVNCQYLVSHIKNNKVKKMYLRLIDYLSGQGTYLDDLGNHLNEDVHHSLKTLQVELFAAKIYENEPEITDLERLYVLSQKAYGSYHPRTTHVQIDLGNQLRLYEKKGTEAHRRGIFLLSSSLYQRVTRYGLYHPLTEKAVSLLQSATYDWDIGLSHELSSLSSDIHSYFDSLPYSGIANPWLARETQGMMQGGVNFHDFALDSRYFNNYNKSLAQRFQSFLSPEFELSLYFPNTPKKYFDASFITSYIINHFDHLSRFSTADSTIWIRNMTNVYNAIYTYRREASSLQVDEMYLENLDNNLINMQLHIKGRNLNKNLPTYSWQKIASALKKDEIALEIVRFNETDFQKFLFVTRPDSVNYLGFLIGKDQKHPIAIPFQIGGKEEKEIKKLEHKGRFGANILNYANGEEIYQKFWKILEPYIQDKKKLYVSADGIFHQFPLEAIKLEKNKYVFDQLDIRRVLNLSKIINFEAYSTSRKNIDNRITFIGNPKFSTIGKGKTKPLLITEVDIRKLEGSLKNNKWKVSLITDKEATESMFQKLDATRIVHIATHGGFNERGVDSPFQGFENSYLKMARCDDYPARNQGRNDGLLDGTEIIAKDFSGTELVVLSACETGIGTFMNAEGSMNISRSFLIAGANHVIATLWKVNSKLTTEFMSIFYEQFSSTQNIHSAFLEAKMRMKEKYKEPYFWAGYILIS